MGATDFTDIGNGSSAAEAFRSLVEAALHVHGHGGYTGTIAEKDGFATYAVAIPEGTSPYDFAYSVMNEGWKPERVAHIDPGVLQRMRDTARDKWAAAVHIDLGGGEHLFFGMASE